MFKGNDYEEEQLRKAVQEVRSKWSENATESSETVEKSNTTNISIKSEDTFASLLRHSAFMQIGNPVGKV